ncbi:hypothetical protein CHUAL_007216 [Chamberlinius hualienensis]
MDVEFYGDYNFEPVEFFPEQNLEMKSAKEVPKMRMPKIKFQMDTVMPDGGCSSQSSILSRIKTEQISNDEACVPVLSRSVGSSMQKVPSMSDLTEEGSLIDVHSRSLHSIRSLKADIPTQVPPLTPGTNQKMTQALQASFSSWEKERERLGIPKDPRMWNEDAVAHWLFWAIKEFSLEAVNPQNFAMKGKDMCAQHKEQFLTLAPPFMGDILWEHLDILQREVDKIASLENVPSNFYESVCMPDFNEFLEHGYPVPEPKLSLHGRV